MSQSILSGIVQSGGTSATQPIAGISVTLYEAGHGTTTTRIGTATSGQDGSFSIPAPASSSSGVFYVSASVREGVDLVAVLGTSLPSAVTVNELTTVAAGFAMAQFIQAGVISGSSSGLQIAALMNDNLVAPATGASSEVLLNSPNADQSNSLRSTLSLANLLAAVVKDVPGVKHRFFELTTPPHGEAPSSTLQALANIARHPGSNVTAIYQQTSVVESYSPPLFAVPDAWTITVKLNDSGDPGTLIAGTGNIAFDRNGFAWITNNVVQGTPYSTDNIIVLQPNGKPADGTHGTPKSPIRGGGLLGTGFGIAIDKNHDVWVGNFGWGKVNPSPKPLPPTEKSPASPGTGSISKFSSSGEPLCTDEGIFAGTDRAQGIAIDQDNNVWICSFSNNRVVVFPNADHHQAIWAQEEDLQLNPAEILRIEKEFGAEMPAQGAAPFDVAIAKDGSAWVTNGGGIYAGPHVSPGSVTRYVLENSKLTRTYHRKFGHALKGVSIDSLGNVWMASGGDNSVYMIPADAHVHDPEPLRFTQGIDSPWSVTVDGDDHVWVANFGPMGSTSNNTTASISKLAGANPKTRPPGFTLGEPISPAATGYTLPSAGQPVLLNNGDPLYGPGAAPAYTPLMRQTNIMIDQAGNAWATNNWKPSFRIDAAPKVGNPGGDGIVVFVGVAAPPKL